MDEKTKLSYSENAHKFTADWQRQSSPQDMYKLVERFFIAGGSTADIGCGDGRDAHWLITNGFHPKGYDSSSDLIDIAGELYPEIKFQIALLPNLAEISDSYENVLCETVIMHLPKREIPEAVQSLKRITRQNGIIYLSWRVTEGNDFRSPDGRLYSAFESDFILQHFDKKRLLHFEDRISESSGKRVCRLIFNRE